MTFEEILDQATTLLQRRGRVSYRTLKLQFHLDDEQLAALKEELIDVQAVAADKDGKMLVWVGEPGAPDVGSKERATTVAPELAIAPRARSSTPGAEAERRQLTVMFCDLVGSTALSALLDPEDLREVIRAYQKACTEVIQRYGGHIAQHLGDGLLVYFGYPAAHEDDAQRAVRAGIEIIDALRASPLQNRELSTPLQVRIGMHTGLVVIGEIGSSDKRETLALGETPNIAARLQGLAEPDTVVLSPATYRLVVGLFECQELGLQMLKGISAPLAVYRVVRESEAQSRFEAAVRRGLPPLVGREDELGLLRRRWGQAKAGKGQVVLLSGEPGIGKSRLGQELKEQLGQEGTIRIEFRCSPYHQNSALYPVIDHLQRMLGVEREDSAQMKLGKLEQTLSPYRFPQADTLPLLAALLSLPHPEGVPPLSLSPEQQKEKTLQALVRWLCEEAERHAVYCAWEDLHWADPSTLKLLALYLDQVPTARMLALLTFRPEFLPPWGSRSYLTQLTLGRLGRAQVEHIVGNVTGGRTLPEEMVEQVAAKTDGVPLFVEELTKMVIESGFVRAVNSHYELTRPLSTLAIPATLHDSLMARLDRLAEAKAVAQLGAVLGREFSHELLHAASPVDEQTLQSALAKLVEAELLYQRGLPPQATYVFKHALIQDTAYQSLLKSTRQQYHRQIAQVLEERFPNTTETQPELLARHYTEAGLVGQALPYWQRAGQRTLERSANVEAIGHLTKGLELLQLLPNTLERAQQELPFQITLGSALAVTRGYAAPEVAKAYTRARELCQQLGETSQLFPVLWGLWNFYLVRGELQTARELGEQLLSLAQRVQSPALLLEAHDALGQTLYCLGEFALARAHLEQGIALYDPRQHHSLAFLYGGEDPGVACLTFAAQILWHLGYSDQALGRIHEALTLAQELSHPHSLALALANAAGLHQSLREEQATQGWAEAVMRLATEQGFPYWLVYGTALRGWTLAEQGQEEEGIVQVRWGMSAWQDTGSEVERTYYLALLAEAYGKAGQADKGLAALADAPALVEKTGDRRWEAEVYRLKGTLTLQAKVQDPKAKVEEEAEECFRHAIEIARRQEAKSWELRATASLASLWQHQGKQKEAHAMLAEIYTWFTEGFDTKDLQEAKALLEELR